VAALLAMRHAQSAWQLLVVTWLAALNGIGLSTKAKSRAQTEIRSAEQAPVPPSVQVSGFHSIFFLM
jgi:hypothetical protein